MGKSDSAPKKYKDSSGDGKIKDIYKTQLLHRPKSKDLIKQAYNTTPGDKFSYRPNLDKKKEWDCANRLHCTSQFDYIRNNLCIKSCIGNSDLLGFQVKKVSFRNYTPKILGQEINMGMWM